VIAACDVTYKNVFHVTQHARQKATWTALMQAGVVTVDGEAGWRLHCGFTEPQKLDAQAGRDSLRGCGVPISVLW
jgi:hypothetical protein